MASGLIDRRVLGGVFSPRADCVRAGRGWPWVDPSRRWALQFLAASAALSAVSPLMLVPVGAVVGRLSALRAWLPPAFRIASFTASIIVGIPSPTSSSRIRTAIVQPSWFTIATVWPLAVRISVRSPPMSTLSTGPHLRHRASPTSGMTPSQPGSGHGLAPGRYWVGCIESSKGCGWVGVPPAAASPPIRSALQACLFALPRSLRMARIGPSGWRGVSLRFLQSAIRSSCSSTTCPIRTWLPAGPTMVSAGEAGAGALAPEAEAVVLLFFCARSIAFCRYPRGLRSCCLSVAWHSSGRHSG